MNPSGTDSPAGPASPRWIVSQLGSREHYAAARAFHRRGALRVLYTEAWCSHGRRLLARAGGRLRSLAGRYHPEVPREKVVAFTARSILGELVEPTLARSGGYEQIFIRYNRIGAEYARRVARHLDRQQLDPARDRFFGYDTGCLETFELLRERGIYRIVDQIDPGKLEDELVLRESQKWPGWEPIDGLRPQPYYDRLKAEWDAASSVLVNSNWSRAALVEQGVPAEKIIVVPLAYEAPLREPPQRDWNAPLRVLWLGTVNLRKGIQHLIEAAKRLAGTSIIFEVVGPVSISREAVASAPANVIFSGRVTRDQTPRAYSQAHLFVLPTISDGFAITQIEAMSFGLPVVTTPNCGDVVSDGKDGRIVAAGDAEALAEAIAALDRDRALLEAMSRAALEKSKEFSLDAFARRVQQQSDTQIASNR